ncbi:MAG TPA: glycosyltransferase [Candidatus Omnitrophota bacterium]|nr:glycosyltransferase [Candidatus Omnitrophota bacterium]
MKLRDYESIVGRDVIDELYLIAEKLKGKKIQNINSTAVGGGVAEILNRLVPFLQELGVDASWDVIKGGDQFFKITKKIHNALHGKEETLTPEECEHFLEINERNKNVLRPEADVFFIHDPQPAALVRYKKELGKRWVWRCHIDISVANQEVWRFIRSFVENYDGSIFSAPSFSFPLPIRQFLISPSIDPLSEKNRDLSEEEIESVLNKLNIYRDKPILTQISRFDFLKDPVGGIEVYQLVKKYVDCQLILAGGTADDDPESTEVLLKVREKAADDPDIHILLLPPGSDIEINALQRASDVVLQKSIREGFGLTVAEALWKAKPVVASAVGGIPLQITHKHGGLLCRSIEGAAHFVKQLLQNPDYAKRLGENGREHVRQNFLLTRHLKEYMLLFLALEHEEDIVYL